MVATLIRGRRWLFTTVYAIPRANVRRHLSLNLNELYIGDPWLVMGDFDCILKERSLGSGVSDSFANWVVQRGLIDLGFIVQKFTWSHGGNVSTR